MQAHRHQLYLHEGLAEKCENYKCVFYQLKVLLDIYQSYTSNPHKQASIWHFNYCHLFSHPYTKLYMYRKFGRITNLGEA